MFPTLVEIFGFPIHTYGVLIATGFVLCVWVAKKEALRTGLPAQKIVDAGFWSLLVGMAGARILYVITRLDYYRLAPLEVFSVWEGGLVFYGGPIAVAPFFFWYAKKNKIPILKLLDLAGFAVPLAHAFGRLGCFSTGCCYGKPTGGNWGVKFHSELVEPALRGVYLHPTQLYESFCLFALFGFLYRLHKHKKFDGQIVVLYLILYSVIRFTIEIFRGDTIRGFVIPDILSTSQFISIFVFFIGIGCYYLLKGRAKNA